MGLDLTLCPFDFNGQAYKGHDWHLSFTRIRLHREYELFGKISPRGGGDGEAAVCDPKKLPEDVKFNWYSDEGIIETSEDSYGDDLTYVTAGELAEIMPTGTWNTAAFSMIRELPPETPIVLFWH